MKKYLLAAALLPLAAMANPDVTSREYKLMLSPANFTFAGEQAQADQYAAAFESAVQSAINRSVSGNLTLKKVRTVSFYDHPGSCPLRALGYSFRQRTEEGDTELTLKFRSPDRYIADFEDVSSSAGGSESKLEADITAKSRDSFTVIYSHSTTVLSNRTVNAGDDINTLYSGFADAQYLSDSLSLARVGGLVVYERVYKGLVLDLGSIDAELSLTLWYSQSPSGALRPMVAEASFKYEDASADYTQKVVQRAKQAFEAMQSLSAWNQPDGTTKTQAVYQYASGFCH
ncbi:MAG: hypothetical protein VX447_11795 [Pseudomonadota bacterium]|uniref:hypothetical protein n=1 Tax=Gallaecimonas pentaromativorans TaxID=584787 RepID=UPI000A92E5E2|nr:hypothetical protein [Gallaecimonas pentaromativorans]MED5525416.1 hypothetical protein [Pseudomonadota bacterium]